MENQAVKDSHQGAASLRRWLEPVLVLVILGSLFGYLGSQMGLSALVNTLFNTAHQLLLNTVLTVQAGQAHSHANWGWETFTDRVVAQLNTHRRGLVFMLWGSHAQKKGAMIDRQRHLVLQAPHPSPLSAHRGFLGCRHFSQANAYLVGQGVGAIDWQV